MAFGGTSVRSCRNPLPMRAFNAGRAGWRRPMCLSRMFPRSNPTCISIPPKGIGFRRQLRLGARGGCGCGTAAPAAVGGGRVSWLRCQASRLLAAGKGRALTNAHGRMRAPLWYRRRGGDGHSAITGNSRTPHSQKASNCMMAMGRATPATHRPQVPDPLRRKRPDRHHRSLSLPSFCPCGRRHRCCSSRGRGCGGVAVGAAAPGLLGLM